MKKKTIVIILILIEFIFSFLTIKSFNNQKNINLEDSKPVTNSMFAFSYIDSNGDKHDNETDFSIVSNISVYELNTEESHCYDGNNNELTIGTNVTISISNSGINVTSKTPMYCLLHFDNKNNSRLYNAFVGDNFDGYRKTYGGIGYQGSSLQDRFFSKEIYYLNDNNSATDADEIKNRWNVVFGGFCWQMIRTTDNKGIKLLYNGVATSNNGSYSCGSNVIDSERFNNSSNKSVYVGYMYDDSLHEVPVSTTISASLIKTYYLYKELNEEEMAGLQFIYDRYTTSDEDDDVLFLFKSNNNTFDINNNGKYACIDIVVKDNKYICNKTKLVVKTSDNKGYQLKVNPFSLDYNNSYIMRWNRSDEWSPEDPQAVCETFYEPYEFFYWTSHQDGNYNIGIDCSGEEVYFGTPPIYSGQVIGFGYSNYYILETFFDENTYGSWFKYYGDFIFSSGYQFVDDNYLLDTDDIYRTWSNGISPSSIDVQEILSHPYVCLDNDNQLLENTTTCSKVGMVARIENDTIYFITEVYESGYINDNTKDSNIKGIIDAWYENNLKNKAGSSKIDTEAIYCGDRSESSIGYYLGLGSSNDGDGKTVYNISCPNKVDAYSKSGSKGNGKLTYPIGLLSYAEMMNMGSNNIRSNNTEYWLISPASFTNNQAKVYTVSSDGNFNSKIVSGSYGIRPSITLIYDTFYNKGADGSLNNPYVIKEGT